LRHSPVDLARGAAPRRYRLIRGAFYCRIEGVRHFPEFAPSRSGSGPQRSAVAEGCPRTRSRGGPAMERALGCMCPGWASPVTRSPEKQRPHRTCFGPTRPLLGDAERAATRAVAPTTCVYFLRLTMTLRLPTAAGAGAFAGLLTTLGGGGGA